MLQAALPNGFRLRMLPRSVPAVFRQTGEIFYIGGTDVLPAPLEGQQEADAIAGLSDPENETARSELIEHTICALSSTLHRNLTTRESVWRI